MSDAVPTRSSADVGYMPWLLHRVSALALVGLLALHVGVQLYPQTGLGILRVRGVYGGLLDLTLGLVLLHGFLGVRSTVRETSLDERLATVTTSLVAIVFAAVFLYRLFG